MCRWFDPTSGHHDLVMMSNVESIFGKFNDPNAKYFERIINKQIKGSIYDFSHLMKIFIYEHQRAKKSYRHIRFKNDVTNWTIQHSENIKHIERLFEEYTEIYGSTQYIKRKKAYFYNRIIPFFKENLKKYDYLIEMN